MSIELNARNAKTVAQRLLKAKDMHIQNAFPQVKSTYTLSTPFDRYVIELGEDKYTAVHEAAKNRKWKPISVSNFSGARELVEQKCMNFIELLTKNNYV